MRNRSRVTGGAVGGGLLLFAGLTCSSGTSEGGGNHSLSNPQEFESRAKASLAPMVLGVVDGLERLLIATSGGPADGVVIVPNANGATATISMDLDGNASREVTVNGTLTGDIATGAVVSIDAIASTSEPTVTGGGGLTVTETAPGVVLLDDLHGSGFSDPEGSMNAADVAVTDGTVSVDATTGVPNGFIDLDIYGEGRSLLISVTFEPDGGGGFVLHVTGGGLDFTIP